MDGVARPLVEVVSGQYGFPGDGLDDDLAEWMVPVRWSETLPIEQAFWVKGMFANQNSACKLRDEFTLGKLRERFGGQESAGG